MNANELMSREPRTVRMGDRLDAAARVLWEQDCGIVPVVDGANVLVGVLTDRDLCMVAYTQGRPFPEIPVTAVMARSVRTCRPDDTVAVVLTTLQQAQVHRLPVVDARGVLVGILSCNDLVRAAHSRPAAVDPASVVKALATIGAPRRVATSATKGAPAPASAVASKAAGAVTSAPPAMGKASAAPAATPVVDTKDKSKAKNKKS